MLGNMYSTYLHYIKWTGSFQYGVTCAWKPVAFYNRCWGNVLDRDIDSKVICKHKNWKYQEKCIVISGMKREKKIHRRDQLWSSPKPIPCKSIKCLIFMSYFYSDFINMLYSTVIIFYIIFTTYLNYLLSLF